MGGFRFLEDGALPFDGRLDLHQAIDTFPFAAPVVANTAYLFAIIKIHSFGLSLFLFFKKLFADAAIGAEPGVRNIFKGCSRSDTPVRVTYCWIVYITAGRANPFTHVSFSFSVAD
jgi:hypothetical protein